MLGNMPPWYRRAMIALAIVEVCALATIVIAHGAHAAAPPPPSQQPVNAAPACGQPPVPGAPAPTTGTCTAAPPPATPVATHHSFNSLIRPTDGTVGSLRLGMTARQASRALHERGVPIQAAQAGSSRFQYIFPAANITVSGHGSKIDTIQVGNTGLARHMHTTAGVGIGSPMQLVPRRYVQAMNVCSHEWWYRHGATTLRFAGAATVNSIQLTNRTLPDFVPCA
jgi:hypothetical protein